MVTTLLYPYLCARRGELSVSVNPPATPSRVCTTARVQQVAAPDPPEGSSLDLSYLQMRAAAASPWALTPAAPS